MRKVAKCLPIELTKLLILWRVDLGSASSSASGTTAGPSIRISQASRQTSLVSDFTNTPQSSNASLAEIPTRDNTHSPFPAHHVSSAASPVELGLHPQLERRSPHSQLVPSQSGQTISDVMDLEPDNIEQQFLGTSVAPGYNLFDPMEFQDFANYPTRLSPASSFGGAGAPISGERMGNLVVVSPLQAEQILPPQEVMEELVTIFFNTVHPLMPCLHQRRFMAQLHPPGRLSVPCALILCVIAIAAPLHPDPNIQAREYEWHLLARHHINMAAYSCRFSLQIVQAAILWTFKSFMVCELAACWIMFGTAYRMAIPLGLHRVDAIHYQSFLPPPQTESHKEERRRVMWAMYRLDRYTFCSGWPMAIDDKDLIVNYPVDEHIFQSSDDMAVC